jgi:hypothetical protein
VAVQQADVGDDGDGAGQLGRCVRREHGDGGASDGCPVRSDFREELSEEEEETVLVAAISSMDSRESPSESKRISSRAMVQKHPAFMFSITVLARAHSTIFVFRIPCHLFLKLSG